VAQTPSSPCAAPNSAVVTRTSGSVAGTRLSRDPSNPTCAHTDIGGPITAFVVETSGTGIATHLGQFSFSQKNTVNLDAGAETRSGHWIAANGDGIYTTIVGLGEPTDSPNVISITEINTIIGGTGPFTGAKVAFRGAPGKRGNVCNLRLAPRGHYFPRCSALRTATSYIRHRLPLAPGLISGTSCRRRRRRQLILVPSGGRRSPRDRSPDCTAGS
jgi:hypothetical protein